METPRKEAKVMPHWNLSGFGGRAEATGWRPHLFFPLFISIILPTFKKRE
jgi:hypothetical protein